jgi:hypothetical protein
MSDPFKCPHCGKRKLVGLRSFMQRFDRNDPTKQLPGIIISVGCDYCKKDLTNEWESWKCVHDPDFTRF